MRQGKLTSRRPSNDTDSLALLDAEAEKGQPQPPGEVKPRKLPTGVSAVVLRIIAYLSQRGPASVERIRDEYERIVPAPEQGADRRRDNAGQAASRLAGSLWLAGDAEQGYTLRASSEHGLQALPDDWFSDAPVLDSAPVSGGTFQLDVASLLGKDIITVGTSTLLERNILALAARWGLDDPAPVMTSMGFRRTLSLGGEPCWTIDSKELTCHESQTTSPSSTTTKPNSLQAKASGASRKAKRTASSPSRAAAGVKRTRK